MSLIEDNLNKVLSTLPQGVRLVAVSKFHPADMVREAYDAGQRLFGENRPQELKEKYALLPKDIEWHMIGHLQTNKVKYIAPFVAMIESLDSERLAETIDKEAAKCGRRIDCLLEIHVAREQTKSGWDFTELEQFVRAGGFNAYPNIRIRGVMGMATFTDDAAVVRGDFMPGRGYIKPQQTFLLDNNERGRLMINRPRSSLSAPRYLTRMRWPILSLSGFFNPFSWQSLLTVVW